MHRPMAPIFISYAREDRGRASALATILENRGWEVWWDHKIPLGSSFDEVIDDALKGARCVLVLWTESSVRSRWVKAEAQAALDQGALVPLLLDDVQLPLAYRYLETGQLQGWKGEPDHPQIDKLAQHIAKTIEMRLSRNNQEATRSPPMQTPAVDAPVATGAAEGPSPQTSAVFKTAAPPEREAAKGRWVRPAVILVVAAALVGSAVLALQQRSRVEATSSAEVSTVPKADVAGQAKPTVASASITPADGSKATARESTRDKPSQPRSPTSGAGTAETRPVRGTPAGVAGMRAMREKGSQLARQGRSASAPPVSYPSPDPARTPGSVSVTSVFPRGDYPVVPSFPRVGHPSTPAAAATTTPVDEELLRDAHDGAAEAQFILGALYESRDDSRAASWYRKAAAQGHEMARLAVADLSTDSTELPLAEQMALDSRKGARLSALMGHLNRKAMEAIRKIKAG
jgi:TPR repeat protein